jgi:hypothetical protein
MKIMFIEPLTSASFAEAFSKPLSIKPKTNIAQWVEATPNFRK